MTNPARQLARIKRSASWRLPSDQVQIPAGLPCLDRDDTVIRPVLEAVASKSNKGVPPIKLPAHACRQWQVPKTEARSGQIYEGTAI